MITKIKGRFEYERVAGIKFDKSKEFSKSRTRQSFAQECNINEIMRKAQKNGIMPRVVQDPLYGDFSSGLDYAEVCRKVKVAELNFSRLPAVVRDRFENDPAKLMDFMSNPENNAEAITLGLLPKPEEKVYEPGKAPIVVNKEPPVAAGPVVT